MPLSPKVSIVIPVYNGSNYLAEAIESALSQTYENIEVLVVNDGSNDGGATEKVALGYGSRIRYFHKPNGRVASALNHAIRAMEGEYFSWLSHDDLYEPEKVARQVACLNDLGMPGDVVVFSLSAAFSGDPKDCQVIDIPRDVSRAFRFYLASGNSLHGCSLLIPKTAFDTCGLFDESLRTIQDYEMWFRISARYKFVGVYEVLVKGRLHEAQGSVSMKSTARLENESLARAMTDAVLSEDVSGAGMTASEAALRLAQSYYRRALPGAARHALAGLAKHSAGIPAYVEAAGVALRGEALNFARLVRGCVRRA